MFTLPPNYLINNVNSISDGKNTFFFKLESEDINLDSIINSYKKYIQKEKDKFQEEILNINDMSVYKVKNINSHTTRYWFEKNNLNYQIYTFSNDINIDNVVQFLIENLE